MSKLSDIKASLKELELLGLPISSEQKKHLAEAEEEYVEEEIIPKVKESIRGFFDEINIKAKIVIEYDGDNADGVKVYLQDESTQKSQNETTTDKAKRTVHRHIGGTQKVLQLRLTFPDGHQQTGKGTEILKQFVNNVGPKRIHDMGIMSRGILLVEDKIVPALKDYQRPINNGYYLMTNSSNTQKQKQIEEINRYFNLGVKVEIVDGNGEVQY